jgi:hypothetical protein
MDPSVARSIAHYSHVGDRDRFGGLVTEHVERVAAAVPQDARAIAYLHDVLEHTEMDVEQLREQGLTDLELAALELLTRLPDERYEAYSLRIAWGRGDAGALARAVKLADLDDHLALGRLRSDDAPPYGWARRHILVAGERLLSATQAA